MAGSCSSLGKVADCVIRYRRYVIAVWMILAVGLVYFAPGFADAASITFDPPPGTKSYTALNKMEEVMPILTNTAQFVGLVEDTQFDVLNVPGISNFAENLRAQMNDTGRLIAFFPTGDLLNMSFLGTTPAIASDDGGSALFIFVTADQPTSVDLRDWTKEHVGPTWEKVMQQWKDEYGVGDRITFDGTMSFAEVANSAIDVAKVDMEHVDLVSLPIAGLVLYFVVQSARLLLITLAAISVSAIVSCAVLYLLSLVVVVEAITPPLVMCLLIAMSIDYSLFLLTRFREELLERGFDTPIAPEDFHEKEAEYNQCIVKTMETSGATISISGIILAVAFVFLGLFPINLIASMGVGCTITMVIMMSVNLTLSPAILASCPQFFCASASRDRAGAKFWRKLCCKEQGPQMTPRISRPPQSQVQEYQGCWSKIGRVATTFPYNILIILLTVVVVGALSWPILTLETTNDLKQDVAYGSKLFDIIVHLLDSFGGGVTFPFNVLVLPAKGYESDMHLFGSKFFQESSACIKKVHEQFELALPISEYGNTSFLFMTYLSPTPAIKYKVTWWTMKWFCFPMISNGFKAPGAAACPSLMTFLTNSDNYLDPAKEPTAMSGMVVAELDPLGKDGQKFLDTLVALFDEYGPQHNLEIHVGGTAAYAVDMVRTVFQLFPIMIAATLTVAFLFLAFTFRSVVIPCRAIVVNIFCLGITYGVSILVYQYGILNWMNWFAVSGELEALPWIVPVVVFFVLTGIGLDYDVFLCVRITEYRNDGADPIQAIRDGLTSVGGIIASAGLVMVVAFGALLFSSIQQLNMLGFMMVISVIFCTMVACTVVNPAILSLLGHYNWWPSQLSKPTTGTANDMGQSLQPANDEGS